MLHCCSRFSLAFVVALFVGLTAAKPAAWAAGRAAQPTVTPLATPTPTPLPAQATLCNLNACIAACQMNNPERGVKETCAPSCTVLIQNRKTDGVCSK